MAKEKFGHRVYKELVADTSYTNVNNGSFGLTSRAVFEQAKVYRKDCAQNPQYFYNYVLRHKIDENAQALAEYMKCKRENIAFTRSTTESINAVLRSFVLLAGDEVLTSINTYPTTNRVLEFVCGRVGARHVKVNIPIGVQSADHIIQAYKDAITPRTRLVILEDVGSMYPFKNPIETLVDFCKSRGISVLVDGAHALGMIQRNVETLNADWYVGCCHKWLGAERSVGFIWAANETKDYIRPVSISKTYHSGYPRNFEWTGTGDYAAWLTLIQAIKFRESYGEEDIRSHCHTLVIKAGHLVSKRFTVPFEFSKVQTGFMTLVALPETLQKTDISDSDITRKLAQRKIIAKIETLQGKKWVRLSAYIYNELADYEKFCDAIEDIADEYKKQGKSST